MAKKEKSGAATAVGCLGALVGFTNGGRLYFGLPSYISYNALVCRLSIRKLVAVGSCMGWRFSRANF